MVRAGEAGGEQGHVDMLGMLFLRVANREIF